MAVAVDELKDLPERIVSKFIQIFRIRSKGEELSRKNFKSVAGTRLFEARVKDKSGIYRGVCGRLGTDLVVVLFFKKKTQKIPRDVLRTAQKRLATYKQSQ